MQQMKLPISGDNGYFLDLYSRYCRDPSSVPADWRFYFETLDGVSPADPALLGEWLAMAYRSEGHRIATLDPLGLAVRIDSDWIDDASRTVRGRQCRLTLAGRTEEMTGKTAVDRLSAYYCGNASLQAGHIEDAAARNWLWQAYETEIAAVPNDDTLARTLKAVLLADAFERKIKAKWPTKKRFGSEGSEGSLVLLEEALHAAALEGCREIVVGGMHRGRLASMATVFNKSLSALISEIKGHDTTTGDTDFTGDVPYHNGLRSMREIAGRTIKFRVLPHPSHLTVVAPVAMGAARSRSERSCKGDVLALMVHTDAAFSGQGLASELLQLDSLPGYSTGGTIHLVVNNQIGFTTMPEEGRSTLHPSDIGRAYDLPIFHVNGDDPVAASAVMRTAIAWRRHSGRSALINLVCYRRYGHNELDEPRFTQPTTWARIDTLPPLARHFVERVQELSPNAAARAIAERDEFNAELNHAFLIQDGTNLPNEEDQSMIFDRCRRTTSSSNAITGVDESRLRQIAMEITSIPQEIDVAPKVASFYKTRRDSIEIGQSINMATAEALAFASLLSDGIWVRLSGQDAVRGTFTQRHLAVHDRTTDRRYFPLSAAARQGARIDAVNSPLSEFAVLSFEYGSSLADAERLFIWEAQFGDFLNGAQVVVDQFITTAEAKWKIPSALVVALPHGLEGQGPDHSSARIERILQSCANDNVRVVNASTPANLFHLLRRQILTPKRKPLFLIAAKSLLRDRAAVSPLAEFGPTRAFRPVIGSGPCGARRIILCSGKIFYALEAARLKQNHNDVQIARIEQLYPFPSAELRALFQAHPQAELLWVQEEPRNQGPWNYIRDMLQDIAPDRALNFIGRKPMAAAAGGNIERHEHEQARIIAAAFDDYPTHN